MISASINKKDMNDKNGKSRLTVNMLSSAAAWLSNFVISFILTPFLIRSLGKGIYSFFPIANTVIGYVTVFVFALNTMGSRFITASLAKGDNLETRRYFSSMFYTDVFLVLLLMIPSVLVVVFLDRILHVPIGGLVPVQILFGLLFASSMVNIASSVFGVATFAQNRIDLRAYQSLIISVLRLVLFFLLYTLLPASIVYVGIVSVVIAVANTVMQIYFTRKLLPDTGISRDHFSLRYAVQLATSGLGNAINHAGNTLLAGMTIILGNFFSGAEIGGAYAAVQTVPAFVCGIIVMMSGVFFPMITRNYAVGNIQALLKDIHLAQKMIGGIAGATIVVFLVMSREFFVLWIPKEDSTLLQNLSIITIAPHFVIAAVWSLSNLNIAMNKIYIPAFFTLLCGLTNVVVAWLGFRFWRPGIYFLPAVSTVLQIIWVGLFLPLYAARCLHLKWNIFYGPIVRVAVCILPVVLLTKIFMYLIPVTGWVTFAIDGILSGGCALLVFFSVLNGISWLANLPTVVLGLLIGKIRKN